MDRAEIIDACFKCQKNIGIMLYDTLVNNPEIKIFMSEMLTNMKNMIYPNIILKLLKH